MRKLCSLLLFALAPAAAQSPPPVAPPMHEVPLLDCSGLPCVELTGVPSVVLRLAIDLGSVNAYLDLTAAQQRQLHLQPLTSENGTAISAVQKTTVPGAQLNGLALGDFPFMVLDLTTGPDAGKKKDVSFPADGALAFGSFKDRRIQLDWNKHVLRISDPLTDALPCPLDCRDLKPRRASAYGPPTLLADGFEVQNNPVAVQIDTLFGGTLLLYPKAAHTLDLPGLKKSRHKQEFPFTQNGLKLTEASTVNYSFDKDALLNDAPVFLWSDNENPPPDFVFDATLGTALLSRALFTFDFRSWKIWMEPVETHR